MPYNIEDWMQADYRSSAEASKLTDDEMVRIDAITKKLKEKFDITKPTKRAQRVAYGQEMGKLLAADPVLSKNPQRYSGRFPSPPSLIGEPEFDVFDNIALPIFFGLAGGGAFNAAFPGVGEAISGALSPTGQGAATAGSTANTIGSAVTGAGEAGSITVPGASGLATGPGGAITLGGTGAGAGGAITLGAGMPTSAAATAAAAGAAGAGSGILDTVLDVGTKVGSGLLNAGGSIVDSLVDTVLDTDLTDLVTDAGGIAGGLWGLDYLNEQSDYLKGLITSPDKNPFVVKSLDAINNRPKLEDSPFYKNATTLAGRDPNTPIFKQMQESVVNPGSVLGASGPYGALANYYIEAEKRKAASQGMTPGTDSMGALNQGAVDQIMKSLSTHVAPLYASTVQAYAGAYGAEQDALNNLLTGNINALGTSETARDNAIRTIISGIDPYQSNSNQAIAALAGLTDSVIDEQDTVVGGVVGAAGGGP